MARKVDTRWYETYLKAKETFEYLGPEATLTSVASAMGLKPKSLSRIVNAGRFLERLHPAVEKSEIQCSYVHLETLERIARFSEQRARKMLADALANRLSISDLKAELDRLRLGSPLAGQSLNARSVKRIQTKALLRDVDIFMQTTTSDVFGIHQGYIVKAQGSFAYQAPPFAILTREKQLYALVFCKVGAESRPALDVALDLYDLAVARHNAPGAPHIWFIFPEQNEVMRLLAEVALWAGGTPLDEGWLFLAFTHKHDNRIFLNVLYEFEYAKLLESVHAGEGSFTPDQLRWMGVACATDNTATIPIFKAKLPQGRGGRRYEEVLAEAARKRLAVGQATNADKTFLLEVDFGI